MQLPKSEVGRVSVAGYSPHPYLLNLVFYKELKMLPYHELSISFTKLMIA
jgi:hypothetical protein